MKITLLNIAGIAFCMLLISGCAPKEQESNIAVYKVSATKAGILPAIDRFNTKVAYVPSIGEGTISAIDLESNTIKWTLKVSNAKEKPESAMGIASTADGKLVFTGDVVSKEAVIVDAEKQAVIGKIPLTHGVHAIDISPDGRWVWVAGDLEDYTWLSATTVIDVEKLEKVTTLSPALGRAAHFAWTPDGSEVWVASVSTNTVWVWDAVNKNVLDVIPLVEGQLEASSQEAQYGLIGLNEIAITPDGTKAFAVGPEAGVVFAIDVKERKLLNSVKVGERTHGVCVTRDGKEVWTANNTGTVTILDVNSLEVLARIDLSKYADELPYAHIAFSLDGQRAYVSIAKDVAVIDVGTRQVLTTIPFGYGTHEISLEDFYVQFVGNIERRQMATAFITQGQVGQGDLTRKSERAGITISVTPERIGDELAFKVKMDTHSGNLMAHDLTTQSALHLSDGSIIKNGFKWEAENESSHHRSGTLKVLAPGKDIRSYKLEIKNIGIPSRTFSWNQPI